jgi:hypothetical protein
MPMIGVSKGQAAVTVSLQALKDGNHRPILSSRALADINVEDRYHLTRWRKPLDQTLLES